LIKEAEVQAAAIKTKLAEENRKEQERMLAEAKAKADEYLKKTMADADDDKAKKAAEGQAAGQNLQALRNEVEILTEEIEKLKNLKAWHEKDFFSFLSFNLELLETWKKGLDIPIPVTSGRSEVDNLRGEIKKLSNIKNQLEKYFESFMDFNEKLLEAMKKGAADWDGLQ
jgi:archaellum component FlaC